MEIIIVVVLLLSEIINISLKMKKRSLISKTLKKPIDLDLKNKPNYSSFFVVIVILGVLGFIRNFEPIFVVLILVSLLVFAGTIFLQKKCNPIVSNDGILFFDGTFMPWKVVSELQVENKGEENAVVFISGKLNLRSIRRERIIVPKKSYNKFDRLISSKTKVKF